MQRKKAHDKKPREICSICKIPGYVGEEVVPTATKVWVHNEVCHQVLIDRSAKKVDSKIASKSGDRITKTDSAFRNLSDPPLFPNLKT